MARTDYYYNENAPVPNSIKPAAAVAIFNEQDRLLLLKRKDNDKWTMPGGTMNFGESLTDCAIREVKEETGLDIGIVDVVGVYTDPNILIEYSDEEVRQEFTVVYLGKTSDCSQVVIDDESKESQWVELDQIRMFEFAPSQLFRIQDLEELYFYGQNKLRSSMVPSKKIKEAYEKVKKCSGGWGAAPSPIEKVIQKCLKDISQDMNLTEEEIEILRRKIFNTGGVSFKEIPLPSQPTSKKVKR